MTRLTTKPLAPTTPNLNSWIQFGGWRSARTVRAATDTATRLVDQGNESHGRKLCFCEELENLILDVADREHQPPARSELGDQGRRGLGGGRGDGDRVERRPLREPGPAVADVQLDAVEVARLAEVRPRELGELGDPLDRDDVPGELREHRGLVPGAGADVEYPLLAAQGERAGDERDHVGLRDGLPVADPQRLVRVRERRVADEALARDAPHRLEHTRVVDPAPHELRVDPAHTPKCVASSCLMPVIDAGGSPSPTLSIGTSESATSSDPWLPPPRWWWPARSTNSQPGAAETITAPAFGFRSAASARARPSGTASSSPRSAPTSRRATSSPFSRKTTMPAAGSASRRSAIARGSSV